MKKVLISATAAIVFCISAQALTYDVLRSWDSGRGSLTGTVDVSLGLYNISNGGLAPISNVSLLLEIDGISVPQLTTVDTSLISGSGVFTINATTTGLWFSGIGDGGNPADLLFRNAVGDLYAIGDNGAPNFEAGYTSAGNAIENNITFPTLWGTPSQVPDSGTTVALLGLALAGLAFVRRRIA